MGNRNRKNYKKYVIIILEIEKYEELLDEDKRKTLEAVFSNKKGDLRLRVSVGSLMELKDVLEKDSDSNIEKVGREVEIYCQRKMNLKMLLWQRVYLYKKLEEQ